MKNIFKIILTILLFTLFFALLPSPPAAAGQYIGTAGAASQPAAHQAEQAAPFISSAPAWAQILIAAVCGLMALVALTPLFGLAEPAGEAAGVIRP